MKEEGVSSAQISGSEIGGMFMFQSRVRISEEKLMCNFLYENVEENFVL